jgi:hypothetical protein
MLRHAARPSPDSRRSPTRPRSPSWPWRSPTIGLLETALDEDGNVLGGLRLPHMEQEVDGQVAGAPLGTYTGLNADCGR